MVIFNSYVKLPEGISNYHMLQHFCCSWHLRHVVKIAQKRVRAAYWDGPLMADPNKMPGPVTS